MRLRRRIAELEARIEALEAGTKWTEVPTQPEVDMEPLHSLIWADLTTEPPGVTLYDEDDDWKPGVYL